MQLWKASAQYASLFVIRKETVDTILLMAQSLANTWWIILLAALAAGIGVYVWQQLDVRALRAQVMDMGKKMEERTQVVVSQKQVIQHKIDALEKTYNDFTVMSKIGQELTTNLELQQVFGRLYEQVNLMMDATAFMVCLYHEVTEMIEFKYIIEKGIRQQPFFQPLSKATLGSYSIRTRSDVMINDLDREYQKYNLEAPSALQGEKPESILYVPLLLRGQVLGVISIQSFRKNAYTEEHLNYLRILGSYTAIAIGNGMAYEALEQASQNIQRQNQQLEKAYEEIRQQNTSLQEAYRVIERNNEAILDSIEYAKRIQTAIMPSLAEVRRGLPQCFIYYRSKDIVSGDFYWYMYRDDMVIVAAVDCTGHGVPGAFMSVLGNTLLNNIVREGAVYEPCKILELLDERVMQMLNQMNPDADSTDGMDVALCTIYKSDRTVKFAGANRMLFYHHAGEMHELKGNKYPVGGKMNVHDPYVSHTLQLNEGDTLYISTDGFADQFGGKQRRKFLTKRFKQLLADVSSLEIDNQQDILDQAFVTWKGEEKQLDDVLIIGVKL